jgi:transposase-like protein
MSKRKKWTPEEKEQILQKIKELKAQMPLVKACKEAGINYNTYFTWNNPRNKKKYRKRKPVMVTSLVATDPIPQSPDYFRQSLGENPNKPTTNQVAEMLAVMNAHALRTLLSGE